MLELLLVCTTVLTNSYQLLVMHVPNLLPSKF